MTQKIILAIFLLFTTSTHAVQLTGVALLNKISLSVRGVPAAISDQKALSLIQDEKKRQDFIQNKINEYLKSPLYTEKMTLRLMELFQFNSGENINHIINKLPYSNKSILKNATKNLFNEITAENLSWDSLLNHKSYSITPPADSEFGSLVSDYGFYGNLMDLPKVDDGVVKHSEDIVDLNELIDRRIVFSPDDLRIAGVLSTPKFFSRYVTTGLNKNRRRAAAIFRVFLCDKMNATIPEMAGVDDTTYGIIFPGQNNPLTLTEVEIKAVLNKNDSIHGNRPDCKTCHYKLDPMGQVFNNSGPILSSFPSSGALVFKNTKGQIINEKVKGLAQLGKKITEQPEYVACQIQHFWSWYIGEDKPLTAEIRDQLTAGFESVGRRTNDFVRQLIARPEFAEREEISELRRLASNVKAIFMQCQSCHANSDSYAGPDLTRWPLGQSTSEPSGNPDYWIEKISQELDLPNMALNKSMPPPPAEGGYILTKQEMQKISRWIDFGAPDESGRLQIKPKGNAQ